MTTRLLTAATVIIALIVWIARDTIAGLMEYVALGLVVIGGLGLVLSSWLIWREWSRDRAANRRKIEAEAGLIEAEAVARLNQIVTAGPGHQVYHIDLAHSMAKGLHLSPTIHTNGLITEPKAEAVGRWFTHQAMYAPAARRIEAAPPVPGLPAPARPQLLDVAEQIDRSILVAGTGAGKTNYLKHYVTRLVSQNKRVAVIDPHSPSRLVGVDVVGAGLDWESIANYMIHTMATVSARYTLGEIAQDGNLGHLNTYVIIEEFWDIHDNLGQLAVDFLKCLLVRARKAGFRYILVTQNDSADALGLRGQTGLLKGAERIEIKHDLQTGDRLGIVGRKKADQIECAVPGLYPDGYPHIPAGQLIIEQPPSYTEKERAILRVLIDEPGAEKADIYRALGIEKNGPTSKKIDHLRARYWGAGGVQ